MVINNRFFYDSGANEGGAAAENTEVNNAAEQQSQSAAQQPIYEMPEDVKAQLAELEELRAYKQSIVSKEPEKTPEQIAKEAEVEKSNFIKFAVENDYFKVDDLTKHEALKAKSDADLVFESTFLPQFKEDNPEIEDEAELLQAAKDEFATEYKLNSDSEKAKKRGIERLAKEAGSIKSPFESTYNKAHEKYTQEQGVAKQVPDFNKTVDSIVDKNMPSKITVFELQEGDEKTAIEIELTDTDKADITKILKSHKTFYQYVDKSPEEFEESISKKIQGWIKSNKSEAINKAISEKSKEIYYKKGKEDAPIVGAENPFPLQQGASKEKPFVDNGANQRANEARKQYSRR